MLNRQLIERDRLWRFFFQIEPQLYCYPAIDPSSFRRALEELVGPAS